MNVIKKVSQIIFIAVLALVFSGFLLAQGKEPTAADRGIAAEDFRRGVISYYRGSYGDSILQFEKALSHLPNEPGILEWLGKSYYMFGIESSALDQWRFALDCGYGGIQLQNRFEIIESRRVAAELALSNNRYVVSTSFPGVSNKNFLFSQVTSVVPVKDGSFWATAYGSNEILHFDVNGVILDRIRGNLIGFDRPMDIIRLKNGNFAVSEYAGDRITILNSNGKVLKSFGESGCKDGQLLGPQYLAEDNNGNIFITDFGNKRVSVFSAEGKFLFNFAGNFKGPSGIAIFDDKVYVADHIDGDISMFDFAGNYIGQFCRKGTLVSPEAIRVIENNFFVACENKILSLNIDNGYIFEAAKIGNAPAKLTSAVIDANKNLIVPDFKENEINIMTRMNELVGGLFVDVLRVDALSFPEVTVDVRVQNRYRNDVTGLNNKNFYFTENNASVKNLKYKGCVSLKQNSDLTVIIDRNKNSDKYASQIEEAVRSIAKTMSKTSKLSIICASSMPSLEYDGSPAGCTKFSLSKLSAKAEEKTSVEKALRLAGNKLIANSAKRAVILISDGNLGEDNFTKYPLSEICAYYSNNSISFSSILLTNTKPCYEIEYLEQHLNGNVYYVYDPEGLKKVVADLDEIAGGVYRFSYLSDLDSGYGRQFLPIEVEVYLHNRSGKDISGYFAPLE